MGRSNNPLPTPEQTAARVIDPASPAELLKRLETAERTIASLQRSSVTHKTLHDKIMPVIEETTRNFSRQRERMNSIENTHKLAINGVVDEARQAAKAGAVASLGLVKEYLILFAGSQ